MSLNFMHRLQHGQDEEVDTLVIGAGVAGLYAAHLLHSLENKKNGPPPKLVVLEASGRENPPHNPYFNVYIYTIIIILLRLQCWYM